MAPPLALLRRLQRLYHGPSVLPGAEAGAPPSLLAVAKSRKAPLVEPPPSEVVILVVGDAGSGKSCFINSYAQELLLPPPPECHRSGGKALKPQPLQWVRSTNAQGGLPRLLKELAAEHPNAFEGEEGAARCLCGASASSRLDAVDLVEVRAGALSDKAAVEAVLWLAARAGVVLCLADSQRQQAISPDLLAWLKRANEVAPKAMQFSLSKVDLVTRGSDRIRLTAKVNKQLSEGLGRGFEVLPIGGKSAQRVLLDALEVTANEVVVDGKVFRMSGSAAGKPSGDEAGASSLDTGSERALKAAEACAGERLTRGLLRLQQDALAVKAAAEARLSQLPDPVSSEGFAPFRPLLLQLSVAVALAAGVMPMVMDEELDEEVAFYMRGGAGTIVLVMLLAWLLTMGSSGASAKQQPAVAAPGPSGDATASAAAQGADALPMRMGREAIEAMASKLREEARFCELALQQWSLWSGQSIEQSAGLGAGAGQGARIEI